MFLYFRLQQPLAKTAISSSLLASFNKLNLMESNDEDESVEQLAKTPISSSLLESFKKLNVIESSHRDELHEEKVKI